MGKDEKLSIASVIVVVLVELILLGIEIRMSPQESWFELLVVAWSITTIVTILIVFGLVTLGVIEDFLKGIK